MNRTFAKFLCAVPVFITLNTIDGPGAAASGFITFCYGFVSWAMSDLWVSSWDSKA